MFSGFFIDTKFPKHMKQSKAPVNVTEENNVHAISMVALKRAHPDYRMQCDQFGHVFFGSNAELNLTNSEYR